jgi:hypothetical protein
LDLFRSSIDGKEEHTLLGPLERANCNQWFSDPVIQIVARKECNRIGVLNVETAFLAGDIYSSESLDYMCEFK